MRARLTWPVAAALLLCACTAAADRGGLAGEITATDVEATGRVDQHANLLALYRLDPTTSASPSQVVFALTASSVRIDTHESDPAIDAAGAAYNPAPPGYEPQSAHYSNVALHSEETREGYQFNIVATGAPPSLQVHSSCGRFAAPDRANFEAEWRVSRPATPLAIDVSDAVRWTECGSSQATLTGDFALVLWQVNATLTTDGKQVPVPSGYDESAILPGPAAGALTPSVGRVRQQYIFVTNGSMEFAMDASAHFAYVQAPSITADGQAAFTDAAGRVAGQAVQGSIVTASGDAISLAPRHAGGQQVRSDLAGADALAADGTPLAFATAAPGSQSGLPWLLGAVGLALVAVPVLLVPRALRRREAVEAPDGDVEDLVDSVEDLVHRRHFAAALPVSLRLVERAPDHARAQFLRLTVLRRLGYAREAVQYHDQTQGARSPWGAAMCLEAAQAALDVAQAVPAERASWQRRALQCLRQAEASPGFLVELEAHPHLGEIYWAQRLEPTNHDLAAAS